MNKPTENAAFETGNVSRPNGAPPVKYSLRGTQLLSRGQTTIPKAAGDNLWIHSKVYSGGGENALHAHAVEDHTFFVLQGAAEFEFAGGRKEVVGRFEGVFLPHNSLYKFHALGDENLVMLRVGSAQRRDDWSGEIAHGLPAEVMQFLDERGVPIVDANSQEKGKTPGEPAVPIPGKYFDRE